MKRFVLGFIILIIVLFLGTSCSFSNEEDHSDAYIRAFETLLIHERQLNLSSTYFSFYVKEDLPKKTIRKIKNYFEDKYKENDIYFYTSEELTQAGPYGKETLAKDGLFLKIVDVTKRENVIVVNGEKLSTSGLGAVGMEITLTLEKDAWIVTNTETIWQQK